MVSGNKKESGDNSLKEYLEEFFSGIYSFYDIHNDRKVYRKVDKVKLFNSYVKKIVQDGFLHFIFRGKSGSVIIAVIIVVFGSISNVAGGK